MFYYSKTVLFSSMHNIFKHFTSKPISWHWLLRYDKHLIFHSSLKRNTYNKKYIISGSTTSILMPFFKLSIVSPTITWECSSKLVYKCFNKSAARCIHKTRLSRFALLFYYLLLSKCSLLCPSSRSLSPSLHPSLPYPPLSTDSLPLSKQRPGPPSEREERRFEVRMWASCCNKKLICLLAHYCGLWLPGPYKWKSNVALHYPFGILLIARADTERLESLRPCSRLLTCMSAERKCVFPCDVCTWV